MRLTIVIVGGTSIWVLGGWLPPARMPLAVDLPLTLAALWALVGDILEYRRLWRASK